MSILVGLVICGIPLAVVASLYVQKSKLSRHERTTTYMYLRSTIVILKIFRRAAVVAAIVQVRFYRLT